MKKLLFVISLIQVVMTDIAQASPNVSESRHLPERISSLRFDRSQVKRIYLAPGLGSIVLFPCALVEVFVGRNDDLKAQISPTDKKTLFLNLKLNSSMPTNLIAKCESERSVFVFDVIPSRDKHQDVVEIRNFFGRPTYTDRSINQVAASNPAKVRLVLKNPVLIDKGDGK